MPHAFKGLSGDRPFVRFFIIPPSLSILSANEDSGYIEITLSVCQCVHLSVRLSVQSKQNFGYIFGANEIGLNIFLVVRYSCQ